MLIPARHISKYWRVTPQTIIHVGAHEGEEFEDYVSLGWGAKRVIWVEALPQKVRVTRERIKGHHRHSVICALAWDTNGDTVDFFETNNGQSSSALRPKDHDVVYPHITVEKTHSLTTQRMDSIPEIRGLGRIDLLNLDIQGSELRALRGLGDIIERVQAIYSEVNLRELYEDCAFLADMDEWLADRGFRRCDWELLEAGWGDALWLREEAIPRGLRVGRSARKRGKVRELQLAHCKGRLFPLRKK